jgi:hypothetical protein
LLRAFVPSFVVSVVMPGHDDTRGEAKADSYSNNQRDQDVELFHNSKLNNAAVESIIL